MAGDEHRHPVFLTQLLDQVAKVCDAHRVKAVDRLIEQQQRRAVHQRERKPQPLFHTEREILKFFAARITQLHLPERIVNAAPAHDAALAAVVF